MTLVVASFLPITLFRLTDMETKGDNGCGFVKPAEEPEMPRERKRVLSKWSMSVTPPFEAASALGGYNTIVFNLAIRISAQLIGECQVNVSEKFTPAEWEAMAQAYKEREIDPEMQQPALLLVDMIKRAWNRYRLGQSLGNDPTKAVANLVAKVKDLSYLETWAVLCACKFRWDYQEHYPKDAKWWDLATRRELFDLLLVEKYGSRH